jgi:hypothetical protein
VCHYYISQIVEEKSLFDLLVKLDLSDEVFPSVPYLYEAIVARSKNKTFVPMDINTADLFLMFIHLFTIKLYDQIKFLYYTVIR